MSLSKLRKIHVIIIGSVLCVIAAVAIFFLQIKPTNQKIEEQKKRYETAFVKGNPQSRDQAIRERDDAAQKVVLAQMQLDTLLAKQMPVLNFTRRDIGMLALWKEQIKKLGPLLEKFAQDRNVTVLSAKFPIPAPPANPNDATFDQEILTYSLGTVQIQGSFKSVMKNISRWNNCSRLVMVGPVTLSGISPELTASYPLTCYIFPTAKGGDKIQMAGTGSADASAASGMGAPVAMPPGMPPAP